MSKVANAVVLRSPDAEILRLHAAQAAELLRALANEQRLILLCQLSEGEQNVSALQAHSDLSQSAISQHLAVLRSTGLVTTRRESQSIYYALAPGPAKAVMATLHEIYCASDAKES